MRELKLVLAALLFLAAAAQLSAQKQQIQIVPDDNGIYFGGPGTEKPKLLHAADATVPDNAASLKHVVAITLIVNPDGVVGSARVINSQPSPLDDAAIAAVKQSTFTPGTFNGAPVPMARDIWVVFSGKGRHGTLLDKLRENPIPTFTPEAEFSDEARRKHVQGELFIYALVTDQGKIGEVVLLSHLPAKLDEQAVKAVRQYIFKPATEGSQPVPTHITVAINFRLGRF